MGGTHPFFFHVVILASAVCFKQEEKVVVSCDRKVQHSLGRLKLDAAEDPTRAAKQYLVSQNSGDGTC